VRRAINLEYFRKITRDTIEFGYRFDYYDELMTIVARLEELQESTGIGSDYYGGMENFYADEIGLCAKD